MEVVDKSDTSGFIYKSDLDKKKSGNTINKDIIKSRAR